MEGGIRESGNQGIRELDQGTGSGNQGIRESGNWIRESGNWMQHALFQVNSRPSRR
jgi:hypothetical protein